MKENIFEKVLEMKEFEDFRGLDLSNRNLRDVSLDILKTIDFDSSTKWPNKEYLPMNFNPKIILEDGKNPGLGIKELHERGITGKGVNVAIIDQKLDLYHHEYSDNIVSYEEMGDSANEEISMHGPGVASLFVGKNCGIAPEAKLHYKTAPCVICDWKFQSESLNKIIDYNDKAEEKDKIKVVSCSLGYPNPDFEGDLENWLKTIEKARSSGIIFVDSNTLFGLNFTGGGNSQNKEDLDEYEGYLYFKGDKKLESWAKDKTVVPSDHRTFASSWNKKEKGGPDEYSHNGRGGISWAIPYLAGMFSLMLQVNKDLKMEEMVKIIQDTAFENKNGIKVINPKKIIEKLNGV